MPNHEFTLEQLKQRETERVVRNKQRTDDAIKRLEERIVAITNPVEVERVKNLIAMHKNHKKELEKVNPEVRAQERFTRYNEREVQRTLDIELLKNKNPK